MDKRNYRHVEESGMKNWGGRIGTKFLLAALSGGRKRRRSGAASCPATALIDVLESRLLLTFDFSVLRELKCA